MSLESVGLFYELSKLAWEAGKVVRNEAKALITDSPFRIVSSLTTLEFVQGNSGQVAHYVLDRTVRFLRHDVSLPPFTYRTSGKDTVENLVVADAPQKWNAIEELGRIYYKPAEDMIYSRGDRTRAVFEVRSENGFPDDHEYYTLSTEFLTDAATLAVVFPASRKPKNVKLSFQTRKDAKDKWRPASREISEVRRTTQQRVAFIWKSRNLRLGNKYKVEWDW